MSPPDDYSASSEYRQVTLLFCDTVDYTPLSDNRVISTDLLEKTRRVLDTARAQVAWCSPGMGEQASSLPGDWPIALVRPVESQLGSGPTGGLGHVDRSITPQ